MATTAEAIAKAVAAVSTAFSTEDTEPAVLVSAAKSVLRLLTEGEGLGLDVEALARGVVDAGLMQHMADIIEEPSNTVLAAPELAVELRASLVLVLAQIFDRVPSAAEVAGMNTVQMVDDNLKDAHATYATIAADQATHGADRHPHTVPTLVRGVTTSDGELTHELREMLEELVAGHQIVLFMKGVPDAPRCGFSKAMCELLCTKQVVFASVDILADDRVREGMKIFSDWPTFPQLYVRGDLLGGLDVVKELDRAGELMAALLPPAGKL